MNNYKEWIGKVPVIGTKPVEVESMNQVAPEGQVFVCGACGKMSKDKYGMQPISYGWDESCMLNAILCYRDKLVMKTANRVEKIEEGGVVKDSLVEEPLALREPAG